MRCAEDRITFGKIMVMTKRLARGKQDGETNAFLICHVLTKRR